MVGFFLGVAGAGGGHRGMCGFRTALTYSSHENGFVYSTCPRRGAGDCNSEENDKGLR